MEIRIIPYEGRKNICSGFNLTFNNWTDDKIKMHIIEVAAKEANSYKDLKRLINLTENLDIKEYRKNKIAIQVGDFNFENME